MKELTLELAKGRLELIQAIAIGYDGFAPAEKDLSPFSREELEGFVHALCDLVDELREIAAGSLDDSIHMTIARIASRKRREQA